MRYVSIFSGVEAATLAWEPLGWEPLAFCEIDDFTECSYIAYADIAARIRKLAAKEC